MVCGRTVDAAELIFNLNQQQRMRSRAILFARGALAGAIGAVVGT